jgi:transcriptional regulator with XRE-family HTH domain
MVISDRPKQIRESKNMSQGDIQSRTGLFRCYISRIENGHTVPALETLERLARALELPLYQLFYDGDEKPSVPRTVKNDHGWSMKGKDAKTLDRFRRLLRRTSDADRKLLMFMATKMAARKKGKSASTKDLSQPYQPARVH